MNIEHKEFALLPPRPGLCPVCAVEHAADQPHNAQSFYYRVKFNMEHGRAPTWADALAHCDAATQAAWKAELAKLGAEL